MGVLNKLFRDPQDAKLPAPAIALVFDLRAMLEDVQERPAYGMLPVVIFPLQIIFVRSVAPEPVLTTTNDS